MTTTEIDEERATEQWWKDEAPSTDEVAGYIRGNAISHIAGDKTLTIEEYSLRSRVLRKLEAA